MRLIDADGSYTLNASDNTDYSLCFGGGIISVIDKHGHIACEFFADDAPTIDAVPVVRCEDCECWECGQDTKGEIYKSHLCDVFECGTTAYDFCSYGERKGGAKMDEVSE